MNAQIPFANRICAYEQLRRAWNIHQNKLIHIKCGVDQTPPQKYIFSKKKKFAHSIATIRDRQIQKQNKVLLEKLINVPRQHRTSPPRDFTLLVKQRYRQYKNRAIDKQNMSLQSRVKCSKTNYPLDKYLRDRQQTEKYISIRSRFGERSHHQMWMRNSPKKYKREQNHRSRESTHRVKEVIFDRCYGNRVYRVEGYIRCDALEVFITNKNDDREKHDIRMGIQEGIELIDGVFGAEFRRMLEAVQYDPEIKQFFIKLP